MVIGVSPRKKKGCLCPARTGNHGKLIKYAMLYCHAGYRQDNKTIDEVVEYIQHNYNKVRRPSTPDGGPLQVVVDLVIISMSSLDDNNMEYTISFYLRQTWHDPLLRYNKSSLVNAASYATLNYALVDKIWKPDTYLENVKKIDAGSDDKSLVHKGFRVYPNGNVTFSTRISATLSCKMEFRNFPMDRQSCPVTISSYFFPEDEIYYIWGDLRIYKGELAQFDVLGLKKDVDKLNFSSGVFSAVRASIEFRRRIQNFLLCFYVPTILTVMLSWVSFFISPNSAPARCALGIITVLAVGGFLTGQQRSSPVVSYVTSADLYILVCYVFVFCALLEYAVVHYFFVYEKQIYQYQLQQQSLINQSMQGITQDLLIDEGELEETNEPQNGIPLSTQQRRRSDSNSQTKGSFKTEVRIAKPGPGARGKDHALLTGIGDKELAIERVSRVAFPLAFALFNVVYWAIYLPGH
ncbi:gamma-aminobutyric acid receptor subunit alpha-6 isoform X2 [Nematostella vectensis]|uniref:gamma-aminobutyric acid receptor subunit alpha-6 isoform X2 n=1 Tax=Nematostella vectensis TaxID=45351 RepID=UPI0020773D83|nr:gamma-aminobutyric acid receptor subunit alpha-6 isoform X2 [Nematostella vectensis]